MRPILFLAAAALPLASCVGTATTIVKAPFQAAGKVVDWTTTSQSEADRNYGRKMRKAEAREGRERKRFAAECRKRPDSDDCRAGYQGFTADSVR